MTRPYDLVVYGATGFTGQYAAAEAFRTRKGKKIAIAGRNKSKLEDTLDFMQKENAGDDVHSQVGIIIADNDDYKAILEMCKQCHVVVNCVGPYTIFGEQVVRACIESVTHHIDISGEPRFLQMCQLKYHNDAKAKGVHIVGTCGFDSIPTDVGLEFLREKFPGELTSAEAFVHFYGAGKVNTGTYNSIVQIVTDENIVKEQDKIIFKEKLPYIGPELNQKFFGWKGAEGKFFIPFLGADPSVVKRTQIFESTVHDKTPIKCHIYLALPTIFYLFFMMIFGIFLFILTKFELGIKLLLRFPWLFSFGTFTNGGISKEDLSQRSFKVVINGKGYSVKPRNLNEAGPPDRRMTFVLQGPDVAYIFTSMAMVAAANTLLEDKLINDGGVLTPGSAFKGTRYIERLQERGVQISVS